MKAAFFALAALAAAVSVALAAPVSGRAAPSSCHGWEWLVLSTPPKGFFPRLLAYEFDAGAARKDQAMLRMDGISSRLGRVTCH